VYAKCIPAGAIILASHMHAYKISKERNQEYRIRVAQKIYESIPTFDKLTYVLGGVNS